MHTDKIAIAVPNKYLSEAVQKYLFSKGWLWCGYGTSIKHEEEAYLCLKEKQITACDDDIEYLKSRNFAILTVSEFFAREEEKPPMWGDKEITTMNNGFRFPTHAGDIHITWALYDEIGKLRPKEGADNE